MHKPRRTLAIFPISLERKDTVGLREKAIGLVRAARESGVEIDAVFIRRRTLFLWKFEDTEPSWPPLSGNFTLFGAWYALVGFWKELNQLDLREYTTCWVRMFPVSRCQLTFAKKLDRLGIDLILDIPTYTDVPEHTGWHKVAVKVLARNQRKILSYAKRIVTLSHHTLIAGKQTIHVTNGVDFPSLGVIEGPGSGPYKLLGIGQWAYWHGVDRLFHGLANHPEAENFELTLAGEGPGRKDLMKLAKELGLPVTWLPSVAEDERANLLSRADVGVGTLGIHRKGVAEDRSLKHRMYLAAGLPCILTRRDQELADCMVTMTVSDDESPIDIDSLLEFAKKSREGELERDKVAAKFRQQLSWKRAYGPLWEYLLNGG